MRKLVALTVGLVLSLAVVGGVALAESGTVTVNGGALSFTTASVGLSATTLTGADLTATDVSNAWTATDPTGTGAGWHLTIASTDFTSDDVQELYLTSPASGTFTLTYNSETTATIAWNANAAAVKSALDALTAVTVTITGSGTSASPWVIRFTGGSGAMTADDSLLGGTATVTLATVDISVADQQFQITLADAEAADAGIGVTAGNTKPTSSVTSKTDIADSTVTFLSAATDTGMGSYTLNPDFELEVRAEVYAAAYTATITVSIVTAP